MSNIPSSAIEVAIIVQYVNEFFTDGTTDEDSPTACNKVTLKTVHGTYQEFKLVTNCYKSPRVNSAIHQEFCYVLVDC